MLVEYRRLTAAAMVAVVLNAGCSAAGPDRANVSPVYGVALPAKYRQWQVISASHEAGDLNDIRVILGNAVALRAFRNKTRPFPDGAALVRIAWKLAPSDRNNAVFGRVQSFVAADATNVQVARKDVRRYAATGGWGYAQFENGKANQDAQLMRTCFACHAKLPASEDFVFTHYSR